MHKASSGQIALPSRQHLYILQLWAAQQFNNDLINCVAVRRHTYILFFWHEILYAFIMAEREGRYFSKSRHLTSFGYHSKLFAFIKGIEDTYISLHRNSLSDFSHKHLLAKSPVIWYDIKRSRERAWHKKLGAIYTDSPRTQAIKYSTESTHR